MIYRFTDFELNTQSFQLVSGGSPVVIEPQVLDLLKYLIANRERLVSRDELFDKIWSGRVVSDTSLSNHIKSARKAIGDDGKNQRLIKTIHGRGYQFVAATDEVVNHGSDLASLPVDYSIGRSGSHGPFIPARVQCHSRLLLASSPRTRGSCTAPIMVGVGGP